MLVSNPYRELMNCKMYKTNTDHKMSDNGSIEDNRVGNSSENTEEEVCEVRDLTQEAVNEQTKGFITPLAKQLEELTGLVQGMVTTTHPSHYLMADYSATSGAAVHQPDTGKLSNS